MGSVAAAAERIGRNERQGLCGRRFQRDRDHQRGVAWSPGYPDGEQAPWDEVVAATARIVQAARVPVTADIEAGYGEPPDAVMRSIAEITQAGAVGININVRAGLPSVVELEALGVARWQWR
jgi:nucleotide-binding universal stress UspA family protein